MMSLPILSNSFLKETYLSPNFNAIIISVIILLLTFIFYQFITKKLLIAKKSQDQTNSDASTKPMHRNAARDDLKSEKPLKNVFDFNKSLRMQNSSNSSSSTNQNTSSDKPFASSYYYAHNNQNAGGGYKDGLQAEDYVMNGPRLLSTNGLPVNHDEVKEAEMEISSDKRSFGNENKNNDVTKKISNNDVTKKGIDSLTLNRYLWDDSGLIDADGNAIAKIYIDTLPGKNSGLPTRKWEGAGIVKTDVETKLLGKNGRGLLIQVRQRAHSGIQRYHLHISEMYGEVQDVKTIVKPKRLIVKLYKKKKVGNIFGSNRGNGNCKAWPQLPSKEAKRYSSDNDIGYIDEDLFLNSSE
mmetsp:Transcript_2018/g.2871  ORF Transcript_2018/g.2871 Transcript_2018/m.2871 type:complete len:354 (-) Transcript_2018:93-1154(-)